MKPDEALKDAAERGVEQQQGLLFQVIEQLNERGWRWEIKDLPAPGTTISITFAQVLVDVAIEVVKVRQRESEAKRAATNRAANPPRRHPDRRPRHLTRI